MQLNKKHRKAATKVVRHSFRLRKETFNPAIPVGVLVCITVGMGDFVTVTYAKGGGA
jgi:hypothetical protein